MVSGYDLFVDAETQYSRGNVDKCFELYQRAIKKITKDEIVTAQMRTASMIPASMRDVPRETLGMAWRNFVGFFKDPQLHKTKDNSPEAYKLLTAFKPKSTHDFPRFKTDKAQLMLKGMQITAGLTLGLMAWDSGDRPGALKFYRSALDLAAEYEGFNNIYKAAIGWETYVANEVSEVRENSAILMANDEFNTTAAGIIHGQEDTKRKDVLGGIGVKRVEGDGSVSFVNNVQVASDKCNGCGKRDAKMQKCGACRRVAYCGAACQKADWPSHKGPCKAARASSAWN